MYFARQSSDFASPQGIRIVRFKRLTKTLGDVLWSALQPLQGKVGPLVRNEKPAGDGGFDWLGLVDRVGSRRAWMGYPLRPWALAIWSSSSAISSPKPA